MSEPAKGRPDPKEHRTWIEAMSVSEVLLTDELRLSEELFHAVLALRFVKDRGDQDWYEWFSQLHRAAQSVNLNLWEGFGRSRGLTINCWSVARGSAYEVYGALRLRAPYREEVEAVVPLAERVCDNLSKLLLACDLEWSVTRRGSKTGVQTACQDEEK